MRVLIVLAAALGALFLTPSVALACSCAQTSVVDQVRAAQTVVDATLAWESTNEVDTTYGIAVHAVYKGAAASFEKLHTSASMAACGLGDLTTTKRYLFFIRGEHPGQMNVDACGGSVPYDAQRAAQILQVTGHDSGPNARGPSSDGAIDAGSTTSPWVIVGGAAVLAGVVAALLVVRRRHAG